MLLNPYPTSILFPLSIFMDNLLFWNCRGAGNSRFPGLIHNYVRIYNLYFLALLEPRISGSRADRVIDKLDFDGIARVDAIGFSGGIWCLWKHNKIAIDVLSTSKYCVLLKVNPRSKDPWLLSVVYGSPQERHREDLWNELRAIHSAHDLPWCVAGDFNVVRAWWATSMLYFMLMKRKVAGSLI